ncbi:MAG: hypothetical protein ACD_76C00085G0009 [uncultured bacterium]|nr:MAG: hypothetical protein ACD_76C00085G0009 [uncultured bacterium]
MDKIYVSQDVEDSIYAAWEASGFFNPDKLPGKRKEPFCIVFPPPNVTGVLHMGHASTCALEDIMVRFARMRGKKTLWIPGTDHAAIATQAKVERLLIESGIKDPRRELGREELLRRVEDFAQKSHDTIIHQVKKMGSSCDWSREAFTLDAPRELAVRTMFKMMYDDGLIYRGDRVINWCPRCQSTLADDEVEYKETIAKLYTFRYDKNFPIAISTTRPETKLGDTGVAVNPDDERYREFVGKEFTAQFAGGPLKIKIIADKEVDKDFGTGALGVTPSHSKIDEALANKHGLAYRHIIGEDGKMTAEAGANFFGMSVADAREAVVDWLQENGLMESVVDAPQNLSICYRCGTAVEPLPKLQWFIDVNKKIEARGKSLKELMREAVEGKEIKILPEHFEKTYFHWINNLRDWNISRQIWYGHRVPVWYRKEQETRDKGQGTRDKGVEIYVGIEPPEGDGPAFAEASAGKWTQDPDTLDTWFSAGLWTFSTLGWPNKKNDLKTFHPTSVLETGYDILFFWVARMILMSTYALGEVPFKTVYLHGLIRDDQGRKMSKSLGNIINPLDMIEKYGADATRLSLVIGASAGNDQKLSDEKIAQYRNFTNKLWNIARFILGSIDKIEPIKKVKAKTLADQWILERLDETAGEATKRLENFEFSGAGELLRDFTWSEFADWYLEIAKIQLANPSLRDNTDKILLFALERLLVLWHPFMPFVTEEIWKQFDSGELLMVHEWPKLKVISQRLIRLWRRGFQPEAGPPLVERFEVGEQFNHLREIIVAIRNLRAEYKIPAAEKVKVAIFDSEFAKMISEQAEIIKTLARVSELAIQSAGEKPPFAHNGASEGRPENSASAVSGTAQIYLPLTGLVDTAKERARLQKELAEAEKYLQNMERQLANKEFIAKAPEKVVADMRQKFADAKARVSTIQNQIDVL